MTIFFFLEYKQGSVDFSLCTLFTPQNFDAVLTDPMVPTGALVARKLGELSV